MEASKSPQPDGTRTTAGDLTAINVSVESRPGSVVVLHVAGEVDILTAPILRDHVDEQLPDCAGLVIDLNGVGFLGSAGLAILVETNDHARRRNLRWAVVAGRASAKRSLEVTGLAAVMPIYRTLAEAVAAVSEV